MRTFTKVVTLHYLLVIFVALLLAPRMNLATYTWIGFVPNLRWILAPTVPLYCCD